MKRVILGLLGLILLFGEICKAHAGYITLDPTGSPITSAFVFSASLAISGNNVAVYDGNNSYLYNGSTFGPLNYPGSTSTDATGVSGNILVGSYIDASGNQHGFTYSATTSTYTPLDVPGALLTKASAVSGNNVVGTYTSLLFMGERGYFYNGSTFTTLNVPASTSSFPLAVSGNNVVGGYYDTNLNHGTASSSTARPTPNLMALQPPIPSPKASPATR
jgi:hypothetical protein